MRMAQCCACSRAAPRNLQLQPAALVNSVSPRRVCGARHLAHSKLQALPLLAAAASLRALLGLLRATPGSCASFVTVAEGVTAAATRSSRQEALQAGGGSLRGAAA